MILETNFITFQLIKMHYCHSEGCRLLQDQSLCLIEMIKTLHRVSKSLTGGTFFTGGCLEPLWWIKGG